MVRSERALRFLLRATGVAVALRLPFVFLPRRLVAAHIEWHGFGPFPDSPAMDYLLRSISALYVLSGLFCWLVSFDTRRYRSLVLYLGWSSVAFGLLLPAVDLATHSVPAWALAACGLAAAIGVAVLALDARANPARQAGGAPAWSVPPGRSPSGWARAAALVLRLAGTVLLVAAVPLFAPRGVLADWHARLGFGHYPDADLFHFFVRCFSVSVLLTAAFLWILSFGVRRQAPIVLFLGVGAAVYGGFVTVVDWGLPLPWWWKGFEGPAVVAFGLLVLVLAMGIRHARRKSLGPAP